MRRSPCPCTPGRPGIEQDLRAREPPYGLDRDLGLPAYAKLSGMQPNWPSSHAALAMLCYCLALAMLPLNAGAAPTVGGAAATAAVRNSGSVLGCPLEYRKLTVEEVTSGEAKPYIFGGPAQPRCAVRTAPVDEPAGARLPCNFIMARGRVGCTRHEVVTQHQPISVAFVWPQLSARSARPLLTCTAVAV